MGMPTPRAARSSRAVEETTRGPEGWRNRQIPPGLCCQGPGLAARPGWNSREKRRGWGQAEETRGKSLAAEGSPRKDRRRPCQLLARVCSAGFGGLSQAVRGSD